MAAELAEMGSWPVVGGWMEQTKACVEGVIVCRNEKARWEARILKEARSK